VVAAKGRGLARPGDGGGAEAVGGLGAGAGEFREPGQRTQDMRGGVGCVSVETQGQRAGKANLLPAVSGVSCLGAQVKPGKAEGLVEVAPLLVGYGEVLFAGAEGCVPAAPP
jgi:hypothetical protein